MLCFERFVAFGLHSGSVFLYIRVHSWCDSTFLYICVYIYRERKRKRESEREREIHIYMYIYIYTHIYERIRMFIYMYIRYIHSCSYIRVYICIHSIAFEVSFSNLNQIGLFLTENGTRDVEN